MQKYLIITLIVFAAQLNAMDNSTELTMDMDTISSMNARSDLFMHYYMHKTQDMTRAQESKTYSCHIKALTHYIATGAMIDDEHADQYISDEQYNQEHTACVCAQALLLGSPAETFATSAGALARFHAKVARGNTSLHILNTIQENYIQEIAGRIIFLAALHHQKNPEAGLEKYTAPCHIKTFVHYCVTGIMINDTEVDELISDETYHQEYELFSHAKTIADQVIEKASTSSNS
jgi:hypothetical protein